jgi:hypothetical protein
MKNKCELEKTNGVKKKKKTEQTRRGDLKNEKQRERLKTLISLGIKYLRREGNITEILVYLFVSVVDLWRLDSELHPGRLAYWSAHPTNTSYQLSLFII